MTTSSDDRQIKAPFSAEQVFWLNQYQRSSWMHPFTCGNCRDEHGTEWFGKFDDHRLVATLTGWICPTCDYTQDWAHGFMARKIDPPPFLVTHAVVSKQQADELAEKWFSDFSGVTLGVALPITAEAAFEPTTAEEEESVPEFIERTGLMGEVE